MKPVELGYWTFPVRDVARAQKFFGALFGWEFADASAEYAHVANVSPPMGLVKGEAGNLVDHYFKVADIAPVAQTVRKLGGEAGAAQEFPSGLNVLCKDDQGTQFSLWQAAEGY